MANWPYNTPAWKNLRASKLRASPLCEPCQRLGRLMTANTVDHVVSIARGGPAFPGLDGLMSMCHACHNTKTAAVDRKGGCGVRFKGYGPDGLPIDPDHPCYGAGGDTPFKDKGLGRRDRCGAFARTKFQRRRPWD